MIRAEAHALLAVGCLHSECGLEKYAGNVSARNVSDKACQNRFEQATRDYTKHRVGPTSKTQIAYEQ